MRLLLDTHIWFWHLIGSDDLPEGIRNLLEREDLQIWLSPITVWEILFFGEKGRIKLEPNPLVWTQTALKRSPIKEAPINVHVVIKSHQIDLPHKDPADRFIAATALIYDLTLVTVDERLIQAEWLPTISE